VDAQYLYYYDATTTGSVSDLCSVGESLHSILVEIFGVLWFHGLRWANPKIWLVDRSLIIVPLMTPWLWSNGIVIYLERFFFLPFIAHRQHNSLAVPHCFSYAAMQKSAVQVPYGHCCVYRMTLVIRKTNSFIDDNN
jgi:hypothetical protein